MTKQMVDSELFVKVGHDAIQNRVNTKVLIDLLIEKGIITNEEYNTKYAQIYHKSTEEFTSELLGISVEKFKENTGKKVE